MKKSVQSIIDDPDFSTSDKIKDAARRLFTSKGYNAIKSRDIANEAGINLALLNYHFESKEKLFDIIMMDNIHHLMKGVVAIVNDPDTSFNDKIEMLVSNYTDILLEHPDLPVFVLSEMRNHPHKLAGTFKMGDIITKSVFVEQLQEKAEASGLQQINPLHFISNILSMTIFPFAARPILQMVSGMGNNGYREMMLERKKLIPLWIDLMLKENEV